MGMTASGARVVRRAVISACAAFVVGAALCRTPAEAAALPRHLAPSAPFPRVIACELSRETIAPGIERAGYRILTAAGPLRVALVIADPANPWVRFDTVLAHDALGGELETVTSMALRTGAVAGINGDYYAVGADRAPLGLVVRGGEIVHAGGARPAFGITREGSAWIGSFDGLGAAAGVTTAIGGGPVLLRNGGIVDDSGSTNFADRAMRIPASALVRFPAGKIGLVVVDGRALARSIGVNRNELVALLRALGAADALLLDSGGSATLVARELGQEHASLANAPSDGVERPVADGLFIYSDAPVGPATALVVRPARVTALPGVRVRFTTRLVDAAGHALGAASTAWRVSGPRAGTSRVRLERDGITTRVPVRVVRSVAGLAIGPAHVNPARGQLVALTLTAWDARGERVAVGQHATWSARNARIDRNGRLVVANGDAFVTARIGRAKTSVRIPVGHHVVPLVVGRNGAREPWAFTTVPAGGLGATEQLEDGVRIRYDFSNGGRAASARAVPPRVVGTLLGVACDVVGDGNGEALRLAFVDQYGARESVTLAPAIDFTGVRRLSTGGLAGLAPPLALREVYVVGTLAMPAIRAAGSVGVEHCTATLAGA
jgi:Phosphodiester glycosidase